MFSLLDMINGSLGYFNLSVKIKNRIYVGLAFFGDLYLIYVTFMLLKNQSWLRGFLYFLAVVGVTYYLYLNAVYYFLGKTSRFDFLSAWITSSPVNNPLDAPIACFCRAASFSSL